MLINFRNITLLFINFPILFLPGCKGCSKSGINDTVIAQGEIKNYKRTLNKNLNNGKNVVKMRKQGGVYLIPIKVNGVELFFIFDTGASAISVSMAEALVLYKQGKLSKKDIIGTEQYRIADGSIHEGTTIILREVQIGNKTVTNVQASVVHNMEAPLLLGQSALERFGKVYIDYKKNEITFE